MQGEYFRNRKTKEGGMKEKTINRTVPKILFLITVLFLSTLAGCATVPYYPPVPFAVQHAGTTMVQDVKLVHDRNYELYLWYYHNKGIEDGKRVRKLVGSGAYQRDEAGKWVPVNDGVPVYLELKITGLDEAVKSFYFEEKLFVGEYIGASIEWVNGKPNKDTDKAYFKRIIKRNIRLKPGLYRITLKSLQDIPELQGTSVAFKFGWNWNSRPFD